MLVFVCFLGDSGGGERTSDDGDRDGDHLAVHGGDEGAKETAARLLIFVVAAGDYLVAGAAFVLLQGAVVGV